MTPGHPGATLAGLRCLIVEDESLIAVDYDRILQDAGATQVVIAGTLARARAAIADRSPFTLALLDMDVDGESSLPLAQQLVGAGTAVVFITGLSDRAVLPDDIAGAAILEKPFLESTLLAAIARALGQS